MKLIRATQHQLRFDLNREERLMFEKTLRLFPLIPEGHHRITSSREEHLRESQRLLQDALREERDRKRAAIQQFLSHPERFQSHNEKIELVIERDSVELLLQVLNDVRVGSWIALGSPEDIDFKVKDLNPKDIRHLVALDLAGRFEMIFLEAASRGWDGEAS